MDMTCIKCKEQVPLTMYDSDERMCYFCFGDYAVEGLSPFTRNDELETEEDYDNLDSTGGRSHDDYE